MSKTRQSSVNFGGGAGGLSTVGYTLYNFDGTVKTARSTTNVNEIGTSTGIYASSFQADEDWDGIILWDTGEVSPVYAQDEKYSSTSAIQDETAKIRVIWNTLKNQADYEAKMLQEIAGVRDDMNNKQPEVLELTMKTNFDKFNKCVMTSLSKHVSDMKTTNTDPILGISDDLSNYLKDLKNSLETITHKVNNITNDVPLKYSDAIRQIHKLNREFTDKVDKSQFETLRRLEGINIQYNKLLSNVQTKDVSDLIKSLDAMKGNIAEVYQLKEVLTILLENLSMISTDMSNSANMNIMGKLADPAFMPMLIQ